jgi:pyridoxamine 5'-phosphate oxidase-like protein
MTTPTPSSEKNLDGYDAPMIEWQTVVDALAGTGHQAPDTGGPNRHSYWLATVNPDGRPHVVPLGVVWDDGKAYFTSGPAARKAQNLAADPRCTLTVATHPFDISIEGRAQRVADDTTLRRGAELFAAEGWAPEVRDGGFHHEFSAPSAGPPPWYLYELTPATVFAFGTTEPYGAARFDL